MSDERTEVEVSRAGIKIAGKDITDVCVIATFFAVLGVGYLVYQHSAHAQMREVSLVEALTKLTVSQREQTCVSAFRREQNQTPTELLEFCKRFSQ